MSAKIYQPSVTAAVGNGEVFSGNTPVQRATISLCVGDLSRASLIMHRTPTGNSNLVDALNLDYTQLIGKAQNLLFSARRAADSIITAQDGKGNTLNFKGYLANLGGNAGIGSVGYPCVVAHESVRLSGYRGNIYAFDAMYRNEAADEPDPGTIPTMDFSSTSMATRFMEVLNFMLSRWKDHQGGNNETPWSLALRQAWHGLNSDIFPDLKNVMNGSDEGTTWPQFSAFQQTDHQKLSEFVWDLITQQSGNFFGNLSLFEQGFQCQFIPDFNVNSGILGYFTSWYDMSQATGTTVKLPVTQFTVSGGDKTFLPVTHVFISGAVASVWRDGSDTGQGTIPSATFYVYPETPYAGGQVLQNSGPPWLDTPSAGMPVAQDDGSQFAGLDLDAYKSGRKQANTYIGTIMDDIKKPVIKRWAQNLYVFSALERSTASFSIPLDLSLKPGQRLNVCTEDGKQLFSGFLAQVTHTVLTGEESGESSTTVMFSHVEAGGFTLPNAQ